MAACASGRGQPAAQVPAVRAGAEPQALAAVGAGAEPHAPGESSPAERPSLLSIVRCALVLLGALPWCLPLARSRAPLGELGAALDRVFAPMCHRMPERSIALDGVVMPLCSRCAGIFAGIAAGAAIARPRLAMAAWRPILIALAALMAVDVRPRTSGCAPSGMRAASPRALPSVMPRPRRSSRRSLAARSRRYLRPPMALHSWTGPFVALRTQSLYAARPSFHLPVSWSAEPR
ncbi:hypothetical protein predicted by Glimmer/Critica [Sorangium cellulosum So ce56]|uniref:DUF2085 domain-containing protein n=1 Tax=Sorangium cellulosum (strain So ce56) TaxID=448385 RepID=A9F5I3_SORC5|nr:hypothetical protein predicted by Glimmer/Critica [Sorangium cellulosum So ce56]